MKFIQVRGSGEVFYFTPELAKRDDVDVVEGPEGATPDQIKAALDKVRGELAEQARLAAEEAERALSRVAAHSAPPSKVTVEQLAPKAAKAAKAAPAGLSIETVPAAGKAESDVAGQ